MKRNIVITIERQYGSGGRTVGEMLAQELGIAYYDKALTRLAAERSGIAEELFIKADENVSLRNPLAVAIRKSMYKESPLVGPDSHGYTSMENLFRIQAAVIQELAETQSCVIIGRAANYVLKDYENALSVFVHAPDEFLLEQAALKQPMRGGALERYIEETDRKKADYYYYYTGENWDSVKGYDLCVNSGRLGFEGCVEQIKASLKVRFGEDILD